MASLIPAPVADFEPDQDHATAPEYIRFANFSTGSCTYEWNFGDGNSDNQFNTIHYYDSSATYSVQLIVTAPSGCADTTERIVVIDPPVNLYVPTSFTPDGDGINDFFTCKGENIISFTLTIYNRWGENIATVHETSPGWDGKAKGEECKQGVYAYKLTAIDYQNRKQSHSGSVNLAR